MSGVLSGDEFEEVEERLFDPAADRDGLDVAARPGAGAEVAQSLVHAHEGPLDATEGFPEPDVRRLDGGPAGALVGAEQIVAVAEPTDGERAAEPPGLHAQPAEIEHRIAYVGELPVEDA